MKTNDPMKLMLKAFGEILISPKGASMRPYLCEKRDKVLVLPATEKLKKYDIVLYKNSGIYVLHRILEINDFEYIICGDNNAYIEHIQKDDIIGVASEIYRKSGRTVMPLGRVGKLWVYIWYELKLKKAVMKLKAFAYKIRRKVKKYVGL